MALEVEAVDDRHQTTDANACYAVGRTHRCYTLSQIVGTGRSLGRELAGGRREWSTAEPEDVLAMAAVVEVGRIHSGDVHPLLRVLAQ